VFAPNDAAFLAYLQSAAVYNDPSLTEEGAITKLKTITNTSTPLNLGTLVSRLTYHLISSEVTSSALTSPMTFTTINGGRLAVSKQGSDVLLNANTGASGAKAVAAETDAANGVLYTISNVMAIPSTQTILNPLGMTVNYATATPTIGGGLETGADATATDFDILAYAVRRGNMATTLLPNQTPLPEFTVFAPNDGAFLTSLGKASEAEAIAAIKAMDATAVTDLVKKHIVAGRYVSSDLTNGVSLPTLKASTNITIAVDGSAIHLNSASGPLVTTANTLTASGVFHTINAVIN